MTAPTRRTTAYLRGFADARKAAADLCDAPVPFPQTRSNLASRIRDLKPHVPAIPPKE